MNELLEDNIIKTENELMYSPLTSVYENEDGLKFNIPEDEPFNLFPNYKKCKEPNWNIFNLDEKTTAIQTFSKDFSQHLNKNKEKELAKFHSFEEIKKILQNSKDVDFSKIQPYLKKDLRIENAENRLQFIKKKRKRDESKS